MRNLTELAGKLTEEETTNLILILWDNLNEENRREFLKSIKLELAEQFEIEFDLI